MKMKWIKQDYKGNKQIWYSADVIKKIKYFVNHMINRCGQVVPYELTEIIKLIESEDK